MPSAIYLSPHLDDVVFSCGGQIAQLVRAGQRVHVVTVFAGDAVPEAAVSPHVQELHERWKLDKDNPSPGRRAEDIAALKAISANIQVTHLPLPDCVYRLGKLGWPIYFFRDAIFGDVAEVEAPLIDEIVTAFKRSSLPEASTVYLPLTAGHHVDHQIVRAAGERWAGPRQVIYYEEYPYAEKPEEITRALGDGTLQAQLIELDEDALALKVTAIACYRSQISTFFQDNAEMGARVRTYVETVGAGRPAERLWRKKGWG
jgi:LmbE family N-acetylglucosaminyl deacetylase